MGKLLSIRDSLDEQIRLARSERYALQSISKKALPNERVSICLRNRLKKNGEDYYEDIKIWKHRKTHKAFYSGLAVCGSVWICPVCAAKISEKRKEELKQAFALHKADGGFIAMLTLTFSHDRFDKLDDILDKFGQATQKLMRGKAFDNIRSEMGLIGRVRAFEVTYGDNGFHPHAHIALFYTNECDLDDLRIKMYVLWEKACNKVNLKTNFQYGLNLQSAEKAEDYFTKHGSWSIEQELTKWHVKKAKKESLSPFDFLRMYLETENEKYLSLFREYAISFKGKRQLQWSQGLKKKFIIEDKTDEQLAKEKVEEADILGVLSFEDWKQILKTDSRAEFLDRIEKYGYDLAYKMTIKKESSCAEDSKGKEI